MSESVSMKKLLILLSFLFIYLLTFVQNAFAGELYKFSSANFDTSNSLIVLSAQDTQGSSVLSNIKLVKMDNPKSVGEDLLVLHGTILILQGDDVAAIAHIAGYQLNTGGCRLHGRSTSEITQGIAAKNRQNGRLTARRQRLGAVAHMAHLSLGRQTVNGGFFRHLQRRLAAQLRHRVIRHAVSDHQ